MGSRDPLDRPDRPERRGAAGGPNPGVAGRVTFMSKDVQGGGQIVNMSNGGALIASPPPRPSIGTELELYFVQQAMREPFYAVGQVVLKTKSGFAVRFLPVQRDVRQALGSLVRAKKGKASKMANP